MSIITFLRHAESLYNAGLSLDKDPGLSVRGKKQADQFSGEFDCVIVSPMRRALETYLQSQIKYGRLFMDENLRESMNGVDANYLSLEPSLVETDLEFSERVRKALDNAKSIIAKNRYNKVLVVSHHAVIAEVCVQLKCKEPVFLANCATISFPFAIIED